MDVGSFSRNSRWVFIKWVVGWNLWGYWDEGGDGIGFCGVFDGIGYGGFLSVYDFWSYSEYFVFCGIFISSIDLGWDDVSFILVVFNDVYFKI